MEEREKARGIPVGSALRGRARKSTANAERSHIESRSWRAADRDRALIVRVDDGIGWRGLWAPKGATFKLPTNTSSLLSDLVNGPIWCGWLDG